METPSCQLCSISTDLKRCAKCQNVFYCGKEHQVKDWKHHKKQCRLKKETCPKFNSDAVHKYSEIADPKGTEDSVDTKKTHETFDQRPLKLEAAVNEKVTIKNVVEFVFKQLSTRGFCIIDEFHDKELCIAAHKEVKQIELSGVMGDGQLAGGRTSAKSSQMRVEKTIRNDKITWLQGYEAEYPAISSIVTTIDAIIAGLNKFLGDKYTFEGRTKAMLACYPGDGTHYGRHVDNPNKDGRCITCLIYLNPDWDPEKDGGVLRLFRHDGDYVDIAPFMNRMFLFWSDRRSPHEVRPAYRHRYAITTWYFDKVEREQAKKAEVKRDTTALQGQISQLQVKTKQVEKEVVEKKIQQVSQNAVDSLSPDELEALSVLVKTHPEPRALLTDMGMSASIQDSLLASIAQMHSS